MELATELKEGILLIDKPEGRTSFSLIRALTKLIGVKKIGHAGTLDPFATGVMVMLIGRKFTRLSDTLLFEDKEYAAVAHLGTTTDSYDCNGKIVGRSKKIPTYQEILEASQYFQGEIQQIPPMFSAKKINGKKLYEYARKGLSIERRHSTVQVHLQITKYEYPLLCFSVRCSKGTYIRSIAHELGNMLGCGAYLEELRRLRSGNFSIDQCIDGRLLDCPDFNVSPHLRDFHGNIL
ncbi:tRNA pseudouridine(55) synthase TruB [Chlamydia gallinacea]|uniref:tRNA pseudouridine synthase B n=2 Tax=Chlamydia gallinacea TaxID=1457153 RepID=A0A173E003_9CHLA|nr:tRNA pseudouridine(55) synthase TruB [Chlamydia gallinacea]EYE60361.1 tRNA pseudouridine(55) synthase [Bacteroides fragilis str. S6L5]ANG66486.1 tRNA pseudouridine(55) synthase TruB [Chlamydia gallinacea 08-1274/3]AQT77325.1 tRNA pseudouridine(55) synthase TruB [Chlamydia gallinacea]MBX6680272.1 tRNA pseudouridine(55) synthase TruB [Chlamydia gallinacea]MBX6687882.1 tRNA pseudouridine(55) synthase TruB [Chlamydia gallinacea]